MIILFVLAGVLMLGGGAAAIIDGLPYLVLERGFTQVIVGTVVATGGVLMLALSWVLVEMRRLKARLATPLAAVASGAGPAEASPGAGLGGAAVAAGAGLAAGAAGTALAARADEPDTETEPASTRSEDEPDLFAQALSRDDADWHAAASEATGTESAPEPEELPVSDEPVWPGDTLPDLDKPEQADDASAEASVDADAAPVSDANEETARLDDEPAFEDVATQEDMPAERPEPRLDWPDFAAEAEPDTAAGPVASTGGDDFDRLRASLAGHLDETPKAAPTLGVSEDDERLREAESWIATPSTRREPWFEEPETGHDEPATDEVAALEPRPWPPLTREAPAEEPEPAEEPADAAADAEPAASSRDENDQTVEELEEFVRNDAGPVSDAQAEVESEAATSGAVAIEDQPPAEPATPEAEPPAQPASSEEGIVGAYQVGDAHFTIYADGSIQARTPDGDYKFGSMEELKAYLASEKSRLGV